MCNPVTTRDPDCLLAKGEHKGFEFEVTANWMGFRCGYVRIPAGHPWHGKGYDDVRTIDDYYPDVHGGLTFAAPDADCGKGGQGNAWWLGFDCAHAFDVPDPELPGGMEMMRSMRLPYTLDQFAEAYDAGYRDVVRSTEYVVAECRKLADQAAELLDGKVLAVCCITHQERDRLDDLRNVSFVRADTEHFRCQCSYGVPCARRQTGPDLRCDWCRGRNHDRSCREIDLALSSADWRRDWMY